MDHDEVCYVDSPLRSQEDFYREAQARCSDRSPWATPPSGGGLTGFEQWLDRLDEPPEPEGFSGPVRSSNNGNSILPISSILDLDPGHQVRFLDHNCTREDGLH